MSLYLGIDFGTSGARAIAIDDLGEIQAAARSHFIEGKSLALMWRKALFTLLEQLPSEICSQIKAIALDGTSSTVLLCDRAGNSLDQPLLYNDARGVAVQTQLQEIAPPQNVVQSATSSLAKLLWWQSQGKTSQAAYFLHQADWLGFLLHGKLGISDYHNALKLGYDVHNLTYPDWLRSLPSFPLLPQILPPGSPVSSLKPELRQRFGFPNTCQVCTGTTDSIAAFNASGATQPGEAVTSLGSTLVLKLLSHTPVDNSDCGIYSHRFGDLWLTGGASNTGGAVLKHFFSDADLDILSQQINPDRESPLEYYPLLSQGDRFPVNNPKLAPKLDPRPDDPVQFLHGLLESIARIEAQGYQLLQNLGATPLTQVYTAGGGAKNPTWAAIRQRHLQVPVAISRQVAAAYGSALLARSSAETGYK
ncbi:MAG: FGGY-family carbohydrate kinase [Jaaginema sp. PMC 1079.18]|nr:FGGY-family carbohydrate kinase [Jaaginema sp. PMC 1080.18]MEC4852540.1 FGGY-family carbohydrate kinase [Jaaginema sp. PMC 1079.18]MEC4864591.1 FGGY-family carbohydrate kinase [Jaaginema sp. PMC 1078.18]